MFTATSLNHLYDSTVGINIYTGPMEQGPFERLFGRCEFYLSGLKIKQQHEVLHLSGTVFDPLRRETNRRQCPRMILKCTWYPKKPNCSPATPEKRVGHLAWNVPEVANSQSGPANHGDETLGRAARGDETPGRAARGDETPGRAAPCNGSPSRAAHGGGAPSRATHGDRTEGRGTGDQQEAAAAKGAAARKKGPGLRAVGSSRKPIASSARRHVPQGESPCGSPGKTESMADPGSSPRKKPTHVPFTPERRELKETLALLLDGAALLRSMAR